jgi:nicotinamide-nucleotide amidase
MPYMKRPVNKLIIALIESEITLALAESMTCGLASHQLSTVKGTSDVLKGSIVCYNEEVKKDLLKVKSSLIKKYTAESPQVTKALCENLKRLIKADLYVAITGLASSGGSETSRKPVGTVFFSVKYKNKFYPLRKYFHGSPLTIRQKTCDELYKFLLAIIKNKKSGK